MDNEIKAHCHWFMSISDDLWLMTDQLWLKTDEKWMMKDESCWCLCWCWFWCHYHSFKFVSGPSRSVGRPWVVDDNLSYIFWMLVMYFLKATYDQQLSYFDFSTVYINQSIGLSKSEKVAFCVWCEIGDHGWQWRKERVCWRAEKRPICEEENAN